MDKFDASAINPSHYRQEKVQCIDVMRFLFGDEIVLHGCLFNIFKYLWRHADKNGVEDIVDLRARRDLPVHHGVEHLRHHRKILSGSAA